MSAPAIRSETAPPAPGLPAEPLVTALRDGRIEGLAQLSPHAACLVPLLTALDWQGDLRQLSDALPHAVARFDLDDLLQALVVLGFDCRAVTGSVQALDPHNLPCLHVLADGTPRVVVRRRDNDVLVFDGVLNRMDWQPAGRRGGTAWLIAPAAATAPAAPARRQAERPGAWSADLKARLGRHLAPAVILTVALQGPILAVPFLLAAMLEAAAVDPAGAPVMLVVGLAGALVLEAALRVARGASLAFAGGRLGFALATAPIGHLLSLPAERVETAGLADQQARLIELEALGRLVGGGSLGRALDVAAAPLAAFVIQVIPSHP